MSDRPSGGDMTAAFASALESAESAPAVEASPASTPAPETPPAPPTEGDTPAAATAQPAGETAETATAKAEESAKGEPPQWRWQDILETQRKKAADEAEARVKQEYEQRVAEYESQRGGYQVLMAALNGDQRAMAMVQQHDPALAARIRGQMQETPSGPEPEPEPDAAIQLADGSTVPVFTAEGKRKHDAWLRKQLESTFTEKFKPAMTVVEQIEQMTQARAHSVQWAASVVEPIRELPYFAEFAPELQKTALEAPAEDERSLGLAVRRRYSELLTAKLAQSTKQAETNALASAQQRALAGTTNPGAAASSPPTKFKPGAEGFKEALAHFGGGAR